MGICFDGSELRYVSGKRNSRGFLAESLKQTVWGSGIAVKGLGLRGSSGLGLEGSGFRV